MSEELKNGGGVAEGEPLDQVSVDDPAAQIAALAEERDRIQATAADLNDRLLRRTAEFDNFRKRAERERAEWLEFAGMETVKTLLPIVDDFERALRQPCADKEYSKGIELIASRLVDALKRTGLEAIEAEGQPFDPNIHQAIDMVETTEAEDQTVLAEYQRGYNFKGRLLRPSMVKVAVRK